MAAAPKTVIDVAGMGAKLTMTVAVDVEILATIRAGECIDCLSLHQLQMGIPPLIPA